MFELLCLVGFCVFVFFFQFCGKFRYASPEFENRFPDTCPSWHVNRFQLWSDEVCLDYLNCLKMFMLGLTQRCFLCPFLGVYFAVCRAYSSLCAQGHSWQGSGDHMWCWVQTPGWGHARQVLYRCSKCCTIFLVPELLFSLIVIFSEIPISVAGWHNSLQSFL